MDIFKEEMLKCIELARSTEDPELKLKYLNEAGKWADKINEAETKKWKLAEIGVSLVVGCAIPIFLQLNQHSFTRSWGQEVANFEQKNIWSTSPGKAIANTVRIK